MPAPKPSNVCFRHALLSARLEPMPPRWRQAPSRPGAAGWMHPEGVLSVMTSFRDYAALGLWRYVSLARVRSPAVPSAAHIAAVRAAFCVPETRVSQYPSPYDPLVVYLVQRIARNAWRRHSERGHIEELLREADAEAPVERDDPDQDPRCPACSGDDWRRESGNAPDGSLMWLATCAHCSATFEPHELPWSAATTTVEPTRGEGEQS